MKTIHIPIHIEWRPKWQGVLELDDDKQKIAADRIAEYISDGRIYNGHHLVSVRTQVRRAVVDSQTETWVIDIMADIEMEIKL